jgi:hypothetical protein
MLVRLTCQRTQVLAGGRQSILTWREAKLASAVPHGATCEERAGELDIDLSYGNMEWGIALFPLRIHVSTCIE